MASSDSFVSLIAMISRSKRGRTQLHLIELAYVNHKDIILTYTVIISTRVEKFSFGSITSQLKATTCDLNPLAVQRGGYRLRTTTCC